MTSDARNIARTLISEHLRDAPEDTVIGYGTRRRMIVGLGAERTLLLHRRSLTGTAASAPPTEDSVEAALSAFLAANTERWVMGYLGFGVHTRLVPTLATGPVPDLLLVAPTRVAVVEAHGAVAFCDGTRTARNATGPVRAAAPPPVTPAVRHRFEDTVGQALHWIGTDAGRRITVATRQTWQDTGACLLDTMAAGQYDDRGLSRSYYLHHQGTEFAGTSPELLIDGTGRRFTCNKLSSTTARSAAGLPDWDRRLVEEHESSLRSLTQSLAAFARVHRSPRQDLHLRELTHGLSRLQVEPKPDRDLADVLLGLLPTGASPATSGLEQIALLEEHPRGPYYGLVGYASPAGRLNWSQILRTVFRREDQVWLPVGAAVTARSTPALEAEEIALKASSVRVAQLL
ncbi:chorismate-binding protein [Streptacidiphilus sp. EB103A]|uniref:chorismate-binding protein n=1 Tax=Streptacidiphilus sp. EB103A TaxID=3156275 RepID=UPI0035188171